MASSMKDIKLRIHSVESTMQITRAMELVAASKLRRAQERMERSRPYFEILHETIHDIAGLDDTILSPYVLQREVRRTCWIVIAGDRGLAGGYNNNIFKLVHAETAGGENRRCRADRRCGFFSSACDKKYQAVPVHTDDADQRQWQDVDGQ